MPETNAAYKLRGFVQDAGGEVLERVPGMIRVRLGGKGSPYRLLRRGPLSWLGLGRKAGLIDMELHLERNNPIQQGLINITVVMRSPVNGAGLNPVWRGRCNEVFCDLRAYLMGQGGIVADGVH
jgi:serine/threonine-protein kinase